MTQNADYVGHVWPTERNAFEKRHGITYCLRCGRALEKDNFPNFVQSIPCREVRVELRVSHIGSSGAA